ncbi:MAG: fumarylacetoacetase, partial [Phycisphaerales bacterium]
MTTIDATHDKKATSWVESAQGSDFPIQNLPWSVCSTHGIVVAIGDKAVVIRQAITSGKLQLAEDVSHALLQDSLNDFMSLGHETWTLVRHTLFTLLSSDPCPEILCDRTSLQLVLP